MTEYQPPSLGPIDPFLRICPYALRAEIDIETRALQSFNKDLPQEVVKALVTRKGIALCAGEQTCPGPSLPDVRFNRALGKLGVIHETCPNDNMNTEYTKKRWQ
jgi:hypothetical protein